jgi:hypothetical protein
MINWSEKARAFAVHFLVTLVFSAIAAALVFFVWFPAPFHEMLGGTTLFEIMVLCDLGLGPLTSFIIYNSRKSRRALLFDYTVVGIVQFAAFVYGVYAVANTRPAYVVSVGDRLEVISAGEIDAADLARGADGFRQRPAWGPQFVAIEEPQDPKERDKALFEALAGKDYSVLPAYYVPYEQGVAEIKRRALPVSELAKRHPEAKPLIQPADAKLVWLPVRHAKGFWTVLLDPGTGRPVRWLPLDPY